MTNKQKRNRTIRYRQRMLNQKYTLLIVLNLIIIFVTMIFMIMLGASRNNQNEGNYKAAYESEDHVAVTLPANAPIEIASTVKEETIEEYSRNLTDDEKLMLAKIAMAEAEGESIKTKMYVIMTVLNRVNDTKHFPNTVEEVIFQENKGIYQFSPVMPGGRWWTTEPNKECWEAVEKVNETAYDISRGALYFESCENTDNWHSRNLEFLFESEGMRFYK